MDYGYARVSSVGQNLDRQLNELLSLGLDRKKNIYRQRIRKRL